LLSIVLGNPEGFKFLRKEQVAKSRGIGGEVVAIAGFSSLFATDLLDPVAGVIAAT
jgi:hypothetical protein